MAITTQTLITALLILAACILAFPAVLFAIKSIKDTKEIKKEPFPPKKPTPPPPPPSPNQPEPSIKFGIDSEEFARKLGEAHNRFKILQNAQIISRDSEPSDTEQNHCGHHSNNDYSSTYSDSSSSSCGNGD